MARKLRNRSRSYVVSGSYRTTTTAGGSSGPFYRNVTFTSTCEDWTGRPVADSNFQSDQHFGAGPQVTGKATSTWSNGFSTYHFDKYPIGTQNQAGLDQTPLAPPSGWYLSLIAGTNPSRPIMTPPTLLQDLVEIPKQLRQLGQLMTKPKAALTSPKEIANHYLCLKFGWLPLIEDLQQLLDLQTYVLKRNRELASLASPRGLRRRLKFAESNESGVGVERFPLVGTANYIDFRVSQMVTKKSWATITWRPTAPPPYHPNDDSMSRLSRRLVLGLTPEGLAKGLWDVIPWTWLLGWFTNVGKYALLYSNTVPAEHGSGCFMSQVQHWVSPTAASWTGATNVVLSISGTRSRIQKTRVVSGSATPGFNMPYLDVSRLSVLSALGVQRFMR